MPVSITHENDESDVQKVMHAVESWVNPFRPRKATEPMKAIDSITLYDLLTAEKKDNAAFANCVETRLKSSDIDLFAPLQKSNLQTFGYLVK